MLLFQLFIAFIQVGLFSVGGGYAAIPLIQEQIVDIYGLMTMEEFSDLITVAEMTPGPISINSATFVGMRLAGIPGVLLCSIGCIIPSFIICLILARVYYKYLKAYIIPNHVAEGLCKILDQFDINYFINMLLDNALLIQHKGLKNDAEQDIYRTLSTSPYRNYITQNMMEQCKCIYFMVVQEKALCKKIYEALMADEISGHVRIMMYDSVDYQGYAYIKIYDKNASRESMLDYLKQETGLNKTVTFGSVEGKYDVVIDEFDNNKVAHTLKKMYEPLVWKCKK